MDHRSRTSTPIEKSEDVFTTETAGLPEAVRPDVIRLRNREAFDLRIEPVRKRINESDLWMLGYNGSIPGPTLHVDQSSEVTAHVTNHGDVEATVHWHGLRLEKRFGVRIRPRVSSMSGRTVTFADGRSSRPEGVVWATGFRNDYSWMDVPGALDESARPIHHRGVTPAPRVVFPWAQLALDPRLSSARLGW